MKWQFIAARYQGKDDKMYNSMLEYFELFMLIENVCNQLMERLTNITSLM